MPRIRCHYADCALNDESYCAAVAVEIDPDHGCATYSPANSVVNGEEERDEDELDDLEESEEWEDDDIDDDDDKNDDEEY